MKILHRPAWHYGMLVFCILFILTGIFSSLFFLFAGQSFIGRFSFAWLIVAPISSTVCFITLWMKLEKRFFHVVPSASFAYTHDDGPWLCWTDDPKTSMAVTWITSHEGRGRLIMRCLNGTNSRERVIETPASKLHRVQLDGLEPETSYQYSIEGHDRAYTFKTAPATLVPTTFIAMGDTQNGGGDSKPDWGYAVLAPRIEKTEFDLIVHAGDLADQGNDLKSWHEFFKASREYLSSKPILIAVGNHDTGTNQKKDPGSKKWPDEGANFDYFFGYDYGAPVGENEITPFRGRYYSAIHGNCFFVVLDTQNSKMAEPINAQWKWLDDALENAPAGCWKIAVVHRPQVFLKNVPCSGPRIDYSRFAPFILPCLLKHDVDLVLQGHGHYYLNIQWKPPDDLPFTVPNGSREKTITFITTGGAGNDYRRNEPLGASKIDIPGFQKQENSTHFVHVRAGEKTLTINAIYPDGSLLDTSTIIKK